MPDHNNKNVIKIIYKMFTFLKWFFFPSNILPPLRNTYKNLSENTLDLF